jgi:hypothetical protein
VFDNVFVSGWFTYFDYGYITENVIGTEINTFPSPGFARTEEELVPAEAMPDWGKNLVEALAFREEYYKYQAIIESTPEE